METTRKCVGVVWKGEERTGRVLGVGDERVEGWTD